jgi:hypothetical protein
VVTFLRELLPKEVLFAPPERELRPKAPTLVLPFGARPKPCIVPTEEGVARGTLTAPQVKPEVQVEQAVRTCPSVPTPREAGVEAAVAVSIDPFAVRVEGAITQAAFSAIVPVEVIVPPVKPVPAVTEVTVPAPPDPLEAAVILPWASTVTLAFV